MRWNTPQLPDPGDIRTVKRFLFWPTTLRVQGAPGLQTRWLEFSYIQQQWTQGADDTWHNECFVDKHEA